LKEIGKILLYLLGVVLLGALLTPPLFWLKEALLPWAIHHHWVVLSHKEGDLAAAGPLSFLASDFETVFHRAALIAALALLWPTGRWLGIRSWTDVGLSPAKRWWRRWLAGALIAGALVAMMSGCYIAAGIYEWKRALPWGKLPMLALSAVAVALVEELLFRGAILGAVRKALRPLTALIFVSAFFAAVHFLRSENAATTGAVNWLSGFALLPAVFTQVGERFTEPMLLLAEFSTLFVLGLVLGYAALRTRTIWMSMGLHAGVVFVKMGFSKFTKRAEAHLPWIGEQLQIGLVPLLVLAFMGVCVWAWLRFEEKHENRAATRH
jgi:uncharacterized protein